MPNYEQALRSVLDVWGSRGKGTIEQSDLLKNYAVLKESKVNPLESAHGLILNYIEDYVSQNEELPRIESCRDYFENQEGNESALRVLDSVIKERPYVGSAYKTVLRQLKEEQCHNELERLFLKTLGISNGTIKDSEKGINAAKEYLLKRVDSIRPYEGSSLLDTMEDNMKKETEDLEWLVPNFMAKKQTSLIAGDAGTGKTLITLDMCHKLSKGQTIFCGDYFVDEPIKVLYFMADISADELNSTYLSKLGMTFHGTENVTFITLDRIQEVLWKEKKKFFSIKDPECINIIEHFMKKTSADLLVLDSTTSLLGLTGTDAGNIKEIGEVLMKLKELAQKHNAHILHLNHMRKGSEKKLHKDQDDIYGSQAFASLSNSCLIINKSYNDLGEQVPRQGIIEMAKEGSQGGTFRFKPTVYDIVNPNNQTVRVYYKDPGLTEEESETDSKCKSVLLYLATCQGEGINRKKLQQTLGGSTRTVQRVINKLKDSGLIKTEGNTKGLTYHLTLEGTSTVNEGVIDDRQFMEFKRSSSDTGGGEELDAGLFEEHKDAEEGGWADIAV